MKSIKNPADLISDIKSAGPYEILFSNALVRDVPDALKGTSPYTKEDARFHPSS